MNRGRPYSSRSAVMPAITAERDEYDYSTMRMWRCPLKRGEDSEALFLAFHRDHQEQ